MDPRPPPLTALRTFAVAARLLSFKLAAAELHVTPGAVSQQIKSLEDQLGGPLFLRLTRALSLTERGNAMLPLVRQGLSLMDSAWRHGQGSGTPRPVVLAAPPSFAAHWLVPRLADFNARHPDIGLRLSSGSSMVAHARQPAVQAGRPRPRGGTAADLLIVFSDQPPGVDGGTVDLLLAPGYAPVCAPALGQSLHTAADLLQLRLIHDDTMHAPGAAGGTAWGWPQWLSAHSLRGPVATTAVRVSNTVLAIEAALAGQGVALVAMDLVSRQIDAGTLVAPLGDAALPGPFRYYLVGGPAPAGAATADVAAVHDWLMTQAGPAG